MDTYFNQQANPCSLLSAGLAKIDKPGKLASVSEFIMTATYAATMANQNNIRSFTSTVETQMKHRNFSEQDKKSVLNAIESRYVPNSAIHP